MKIQGQVIAGPNIETIIIPRGDSQLVFRAKAILDYTDFEKLCPMPEPPKRSYPDGRVVLNVEDPKFKKKLDEHGSLRFAWMVLKSLEATEGLEWETVNLEDPSTWANYETEFKSAGISDVESSRIARGVMIANCLDDDKVEQARQRFLALEKEAADNKSFLPGEKDSTESGESASD